jgi:hypothetical protein
VERGAVWAPGVVGLREAGPEEARLRPSESHSSRCVELFGLQGSSPLRTRVMSEARTGGLGASESAGATRMDMRHIVVAIYTKRTDGLGPHALIYGPPVLVHWPMAPCTACKRTRIARPIRQRSRSACSTRGTRRRARHRFATAQAGAARLGWGGSGAVEGRVAPGGAIAEHCTRPSPLVSLEAGRLSLPNRYRLGRFGTETRGGLSAGPARWAAFSLLGC